MTFVYFPIAHMVWYWAGPAATVAAVKSVAAATADAKVAAQTPWRVSADGGLAYQWGAIDFAGGTVVHINAGIAALVGALDPRAALRLWTRGDAAAFLDAGDGRRGAVVGRVVRFQLRIEPRSQRYGSTGDGQYVRCHCDGRIGLDVHRVGDEGQGDDARRYHRHGRRTGGGNASVGLRRSEMGAMALGAVAGVVCFLFLIHP